MPLGGQRADEVLAALKDVSGWLRGMVGRSVTLRSVPKLSFLMDEAFDQSSRIDTLLRSPEVARDLDPGLADEDEDEALDESDAPPVSPTDGGAGWPVNAGIRLAVGWCSISLRMTSTRAVSMVRRVFDAAKAGHAGTLDPLATGILPIALGEATKTVPYVMDATKEYTFTVRWGESRSTDDREGNVTATSDVRRPSRRLRLFWTISSVKSIRSRPVSRRLRSMASAPTIWPALMRK